MRCLFHNRVDIGRGKFSFNTASEIIDLKQAMQGVELGESICDYFANMKHQNPTQLLNVYMLHLCLLFSCIFKSVPIILKRFDNPSLIKLLSDLYEVHSSTLKEFHLSHETDVYGCCGCVEGKASKQFGSDGVRILTARVCAKHKCRRGDGAECWEKPPGKGKRRYCDNCIEFEQLCCAYDKKTRLFCNDIVTGTIFLKCQDHTEYTSTCSSCIESVIPQNRFCREHARFEEPAKKFLEKSQYRQKLNDHKKRDGIKRNYRNSYHSLDNEINEMDETQNDGWDYFVSVVFTYGWIFIQCTCGIILHQEPMLRSESVKQHVSMVLDLFGDQLKYQNVWWVDKACQILQSLSTHPNKFKPFENTLILVDRFHGDTKHNQNGGTNPLTKLCIENCDVSKMSKSKLLREFACTVDGDGNDLGNTSISEQVMKVVGSFKHVVMKMHIIKQKFFILWLCYDLNQLKMIKRHNKIAQKPKPTYPF